MAPLSPFATGFSGEVPGGPGPPGAPLASTKRVCCGFCCDPAEQIGAQGTWEIIIIINNNNNNNIIIIIIIIITYGHHLDLPLHLATVPTKDFLRDLSISPISSISPINIMKSSPVSQSSKIPTCQDNSEDTCPQRTVQTRSYAENPHDASMGLVISIPANWSQWWDYPRTVSWRGNYVNFRWRNHKNQRKSC